MKRKTILYLLAISVLVVALLLTDSTSFATPAATYTIDWYTIDGGGTMSLSGGTYTLNGTIGQFDAGTQSGGNYQLNGGFWGVVDSIRKLFLPLIMR